MNLLSAVLNGPLVMLLVMVLFSVLLRWTFHDRPRAEHPSRPEGDFGLLVAVATVRTTATADQLGAQLAESGVRSTTTPSADGHGLHILVFRDDAATAEHLLTHLT